MKITKRKICASIPNTVEYAQDVSEEYGYEPETVPGASPSWENQEIDGRWQVIAYTNMTNSGRPYGFGETTITDIWEDVVNCAHTWLEEDMYVQIIDKYTDNDVLLDPISYFDHYTGEFPIYPEDLDPEISTQNQDVIPIRDDTQFVDVDIESSEEILGNDFHKIDWDKLWEISDRYNGDTPLSGGWDTELKHEQRAISDELGVSMDEAKHLMIDHLEIPADAFDHPLAASTEIEADEEIEITNDYVEQLQDAVVDKIIDIRKDAAVTFSEDDTTLYFTVTVPEEGQTSSIMEYAVPKSDLKANITTDVKYVVDEIDNLKGEAE